MALPPSIQSPTSFNPLSFIKSSAIAAWSTLKHLVAPPPQPLSQIQEDDLVATRARLERWRSNSYKFADVLFKAVSWTLLTGVVLGFWRATGYFPFFVMLVVMAVAFVVFVVCRGVYPVIDLVTFFAKRTGHYNAWFIAVAVAVFMMCVTTVPLLIFPVAVRKATLALHCASTDHDLARRPADCPHRPKLRLPSSPTR